MVTYPPPISPDIYAGDIAIALGIFFGLLSIALAVWFGFSEKIRDFLHESKKGQIDEKIAVIYSHAANISSWYNTEETIKNFNTERIKSDVRSIGRLKKSVGDEQKEALILAKNELLREMKNNGLSKESEEISLVFTALLW